MDNGNSNELEALKQKQALEQHALGCKLQREQALKEACPSGRTRGEAARLRALAKQAINVLNFYDLETDPPPIASALDTAFAAVVGRLDEIK